MITHYQPLLLLLFFIPYQPLLPSLLIIAITDAFRDTGLTPSDLKSHLCRDHQGMDQRDDDEDTDSWGGDHFCPRNPSGEGYTG